MPLTAFIRSLQKEFSPQQLLTHEADCWAYGYDNSRQQALPEAVVFPNSSAEVSKLVRLCRKHKRSLVARGKGTGTTGATVPVCGGLVVSFERMNKILHLAAADRYVQVQPGVTNAELQQAVAAKGFFWPPDPTSSAVCTIGGNLACNAAGPRAVKYGTPRDNTLGLTFVNGLGEVIHSGVKTTKGVVGYDLTRLLIGSEGTLGIITEAVLKLTPLASKKHTLRACYSSIEAATRAVAEIMQQPVIPCALEFIDAAAIHMVQDFARIDLPPGTQALLMIEVDGEADCIDQASQKVAQSAQNSGCLSCDVASTKQQTKALWQVRKSLSPALRNVAPKKLNEDVVVPVSKIPLLIESLQKLSAKHQTRIVNFGHAGNGNIHVNLLFDPDDKAQLQRAEQCLTEVFHKVLALGGTLSGEHGIGLVKRDFVALEVEQKSLQLMHGIKSLFDPDGILNPGKTIPDI
ncbi:MAG: FAD-binding protein [gamma proteobacterium symbiont of Bathyaustriella thionipta]|nr:FAD-binding protein [gamma proteobacterium symbiont of Bathyaustriella thionipta]